MNENPSKDQNISALSGLALSLAYFTVGYNILEGVLSVITGTGVNSSALIGFGLDSFIESLSGGIMIWRFSGVTNLNHQQIEKREKRAIELISYTFVVLGLYVLFESTSDLLSKQSAEPTVFGIVIAIVSLVVMPILYVLKRRAGAALESHSQMADANQTLACVMLSAALLIGLAVNMWLGYGWADAVAGEFIAVFLLREGYLTYRNKQLCAC